MAKVDFRGEYVCVSDIFSATFERTYHDYRVGVSVYVRRKARV